MVLAAAGTSWAGLIGSRHDFSSTGPYNYPTVTPMGACSGCHIPHSGVLGAKVWSRNLVDEMNFFDQTSNPNYTPGSTLLCYDCHNEAPTSSPPHATDNDPSPNWGTHPPQNIAFTDDVPGNPETTPSQVGYYERIDGTVGPGPTNGSPTGGHYWQQDPNGAQQPGDKIACDLCHDPHDALTGSNDVYFRLRTPADSGGVDLTRIENTHRASPNVHDETPGGDGRSMCAECHGYASPSTILSVTLYGRELPRPTTTMPQHRQADSTPCTNCHKHNKIKASCRECHGYPPLLTYAQASNQFFDATSRPTVENYLNGAGAHQRHLDALGTLIFSCEICHGPNPGSASWHNTGTGTVLQANVDIMGAAASWDPGGTRVTAYSGNPSGETLPAGYEFVAKGGGNQQCSGLACHGGPPASPVVLTWTADMVDGDTPYDNPAAGDVRICKWCHDGTPAMVDFGAGLVTARNVLGNNNGAGGTWTSGSWGADVNGHGLASGSRYDTTALNTADGRNGAAKECTVCHDATYSGATPAKTHFDGTYLSSEKRLRSTINGQSVTGPDGACTACHQNTGGDAGTRLSHHGNDTTGGYVPLEGNFTRVCRQCHDVHGANWNGASRNLNMIGKWLDQNRDGIGDAGEGAFVDSDATSSATNITAASDRAVVFTARTGTNSFDENDGAYNAADDADDVCAACHAPVTTPPTGTGGGLHNGTTGMSDERGGDCLQCHDHDFDDVETTPDAFMPSGCTGCHGEGGVVHQGTNGGLGDNAPNVMTVNVAGTWYSVWDGEWWDTQMGGGNVQQGGHGDPDGRAAVECTDCHNTGSPQPNTHLNGTHESVGDTAAPANQNANTAHLKPDFFTKYAPGTPGTYSIQVAVDNYCYQECHATATVRNHRHEQDSWGPDGRQGTADDITTIPPRYVVELGTHLTGTVPDPVPPRTWRLPMDSDLNSAAAGTPNYAPCISCHNPHGTTTTETKRSSNKMIRDPWIIDEDFCKACHI